MQIDKLVLALLVRNPEYREKVSPYLKEEYFQSREEKNIFRTISEHASKYRVIPDKTQLKIECQSKEWNSDTIEEYIDDIWECDLPEDNKWSIQKTEEFCKNQAVYNAIIQSIAIYDGSDKSQTTLAIPELIKSAVNINFDSTIGLDIFDDAEARFKYYTQPEFKIPFKLSALNEITNGGLTTKTLTLIMAGCVHPETEIEVRLNGWVIQIPIQEVRIFIDHGIEVSSPDGWVRVTDYVDKGNWKEYILTLDNGDVVRCNENHLFETLDGWVSAKDLSLESQPNIFITSRGNECGVVRYTGYEISIVDIRVEHENHRYYTNGVSSHNTGAGKSMLMISLASDYIKFGYDVLYITMEMREEEIFRRVDAHLLDVNINNVALIEHDDFMSKIDKLKKKSYGRLKVKEYPSGVAHAGHFKNLISDLRSKKSFTPKVVFVDYLGIIASSRIKAGSQNSYFCLKSAAEELRALASEEDVAVISAMQIIRSALSSSDFDLADISEGTSTAHTADMVLGLIRTDELDQSGQILLKQLKNRFGNKANRTRMLMGVDLDTQKVYDISNSAIQDELVVPESVMKSSSGKSLKDKFRALNG